MDKHFKRWVSWIKELVSDTREAFTGTEMYIALFVAFVITVILVVSCASRADAADANVTWTHPTQRIDSTPLPLTEIKETQVDYAQCTAGALTFPATPVGTVKVPAPATNTIVTGLGYGTWCFRARTVDTGGLMSDNSGQISKTVLAPPKPPVFTAVSTSVYDIRNGELGRVVGVVKFGTVCGEPVIASGLITWNRMDRKDVRMIRSAKGDVLVALCAAA